MQIVVVSMLALLDTSGRRDAAPKSEELGDAWTAGAAGEDCGLAVQEYYNRTLRRSETWHQTAGREWFLKVREGVYVLALQEASGRWRTHPSTRLVRRGEEWRRIEPALKR